MLSLGEIDFLLENMSSLIRTPAMVHINREMSPVLVELLTLEPGMYDHPAVKQLFNWLVDPKRNGKEFIYALAPLQDHLAEILDEGKLLRSDVSYLVRVGAEALATRCPVLEGHWVLAAWFLIREEFAYTRKKNGVVSDRLSAWIINMIGNPDLCPNPYMRIEFLVMLDSMVSGDDMLRIDNEITYQKFVVSDSTKEQILGSLLFMLRFHSTDYYHINFLDHIEDTLRMLSEDGYLKKFDERLSKQLLDVKTSRIFDMVHDVAKTYALNPNTNTHPVELHGISVLLETIALFARRGLDEEEMGNQMYMVPKLLCLILRNFMKSCHTPQLAGQVYICTKAITKLMTAASLKGMYVDKVIYTQFRELKIIHPDSTFRYLFEI